MSPTPRSSEDLLFYAKSLQAPDPGMSRSKGLGLGVDIRAKGFRVEGYGLKIEGFGISGFRAYGRGVSVSFLGVGFSWDADIDCPNTPRSIPVLQCRVWGLEFTVWGFGLGFRIWGTGFRVCGWGFRLWCSGFRVVCGQDETSAGS